MDPLSALAVAAAVVQFADIGYRIVTKKRSEWAAESSSEDDASLAAELAASIRLVHEASDSILELGPSGSATKTSAECILLAREHCDALDAELQRHLEKRKDVAALAFLPWRKNDRDRLKSAVDDIKTLASDVVLLCVWEEARDSKRRDAHFHNRLNDIVEILKRLTAGEDGGDLPSFGNLATFSATGTSTEPSKLGILGRLQAPSREVAGSLLHLVDGSDPRNPGVPANRYLLFQNRTDLAVELYKVIWARDWQLDPSMMDVSGVDIDRMAQHICEDLRFESLETRDAAIADAILQTYSWVYDRSPPPDDKGALKWSSFPDWLEDPSQTTYWITGKPGSGKSTIMKYILSSDSRLRSHLEKWAHGIPLLITQYYAWNAGDTLQKSFQGLKRTLLFQALQQDPKLLPILAPRRWAYFNITGGYIPPSLPDWSPWEIDESFANLLSESGQSFHLVIFVDGLDEFDAPPREVVAMVKSITPLSPSATDTACAAIKVCVASRPWVEFDDAYRTVPQLAMNLLTSNDMWMFIAEVFRDCRALRELREIYPTEASKLLDDLATKAQGIFIWLKVVAMALVEEATSGAGILVLQDIVDGLPSDVSALYTAIWARIPNLSRQRGAALLRLVVSFADLWPVGWYSTWLADEYFLRPHADIRKVSGDRRLNLQQVTSMKASMRRKLASRTRGLLEILNNGSVSFVHRTVKEWASRPEEWEALCQYCPEHFDPYLCMLGTYIHRLSAKRTDLAGSDPPLWEEIGKALWCASLVGGDHKENVDALVDHLDSLDRIAGEQLQRTSGPAANGSTFHWAAPIVVAPEASGALTILNRKALESQLRPTNQVSFVTVAARFSISAYVNAKATPRRAVVSQEWILEEAIFGELARFTGRTLSSCRPLEHTMRRKAILPTDNPEDYKRRLQVVQLLCSLGVDQRDIIVEGKARSLKAEIQQRIRLCHKSNLPHGEAYYKEVLQIVGRRSNGLNFLSSWVKGRIKE